MSKSNKVEELAKLLKFENASDLTAVFEKEMLSTENKFKYRRILEFFNNDITSIVSCIAEPFIQSFKPERPRVLLYVYLNVLEMAVAINAENKTINIYDIASAPNVSSPLVKKMFDMVTMITLTDD